MDDSRPTPNSLEFARRKSNASGRSCKLADGSFWLLIEPIFQPTSKGLTRPHVDKEIDRFHEHLILGEDIYLTDVFSVARLLLLANYVLSSEEIADLLEVEEGSEAEALTKSVLESLFGPDQRVRGYTSWVQASLLANGLETSQIPASSINDVLTILLSTNRTVVPSLFVDVCRAELNRDSLESLV